MGMRAEVYLDESRSSDGTTAKTGVGYPPQGVLLFPTMPSGTATSGTLYGLGAGVSLGASVNHAMHIECGASAVSGSVRSNRCMMFKSNNVTLSDAVMASLDANGYTLTFDHTNAPTYSYIQIPLGGLTNIGVVATQTIAAPGTQDITGFGFDPTSVILFVNRHTAADITNDAGLCIGFGGSDLTQACSYAKIRQASGAISGQKVHNAINIIRTTAGTGANTPTNTANLDSYITDGVRLTYTTANAGYSITAIGLRGVTTNVQSIAIPTSTGNVSYAGVPFKPGAAIITHVDGNGAINTNDSDIGIGAIGNSGSQAAAFQTGVQSSAFDIDSVRANNRCIIACNSSGTVIYAGEWVSWDSNGMTLNFPTVTTARTAAVMYFEEPTISSSRNLLTLGVG